MFFQELHVARNGPWIHIELRTEVSGLYNFLSSELFQRGQQAVESPVIFVSFLFSPAHRADLCQDQQLQALFVQGLCHEQSLAQASCGLQSLVSDEDPLEVGIRGITHLRHVFVQSAEIVFFEPRKVASRST